MYQLAGECKSSTRGDCENEEEILAELLPYHITHDWIIVDKNVAAAGHAN